MPVATSLAIHAASLVTLVVNRERRRLKNAQSNGMAEAFVRTIKRDYLRFSRVRMSRP